MNRNSSLVRVLLLGMTAGLAACVASGSAPPGSDDGGGTMVGGDSGTVDFSFVATVSASCNRPGDYICIEYDGSPRGDTDAKMADCATHNGTWLEFYPCPQAHALGGCRVNFSTNMPGAITTWYYLGPMYQGAPDVMKACGAAMYLTGTPPDPPADMSTAPADMSMSPPDMPGPKG